MTVSPQSRSPRASACISASVRQRPGKGDGCNPKPFKAIQRVQLPPGKGAARQPEASLAWAAATLFVKRRRQMLKPCGKPRDHAPAGAFGLLGPGAASESPLRGEDLSARPGPWSRAKAWDGSPGNLRDPARVHERKTAGIGTP